MLHKDFFRLVIKLFGLYSLILILFTILPQSLTYYFQVERWEQALMLFSLIAIPVILFLFAIFRTDLIISVLKLDKGFEGEKITFGEMSGANILQLGSIVIGGLLIIDNLPTLFNQTFFLFKDSIQHIEGDSRQYYYLGVSAVKIVIGYLMLRNYVWVGKLLRVKE